MNCLIKSNRSLSLIKLARFKSTNIHSDFKYCIDSVKTNDFNDYLTALLTPQEAQRIAFAVRALNIELLSIGRSRNDKRISEMKLQFWKDQINKIFSKVKEQDKNNNVKLFEPISNELAACVRKHNLSKVWFNRMIEGRSQFLNMQQFNTYDELEKCADSSMSSLYYIILNSLNTKNVDCDHAASHLGKSQMLCGIVRNLLKRSSQSVYYVPTDLLVKHKIAQQDLINLNEKILRSKQQQLKDLTFDMCTRAKHHLNSVYNLKSKIPKEVQLVFAPAIVMNVFLDKMQMHDFDLMNKNLGSDFRSIIIWKIILAKFRKSF